MSRWLLACLALVAAAALVLWPRGEAVVGVAGVDRDVSVPDEARATEPTMEAADAEVPAARVAAMAAVPEAAPAPAPIATRLSVQVLVPGGRPWAGGFLQLWTPSTLERTLLGPDLQRGFPRETARGQRFLTVWRCDEDGRIVVDGLVAGEAFELAAIDAWGDVGGTLEEPALAPGEARDVVLRLDRHPERVEGRCVDEQGLPLERVRIQFVGGGPRSESETDLEGRFATAETFGDEVELEFRRRGLAVHRERVALPQARPLELVLAPARVLTVTLVDERGERIALNGLRARATDGTTLVDTHPEQREGDFLFEFMPRTSVTLEIVGCGTAATLAVDADAAAVRWTLPRPGRLEIGRGTPPPDTPRVLTAELRRADSGELVFSDRLLTDQLHAPQRWTLFPARYTLQLVRNPGPENPERTHFGQPHEFEIAPGATVSVTLGD